jgi:hypothetical protein
VDGRDALPRSASARAARPRRSAVEVAESGRRRKYYRITSRGLAQLAEERRQWQAVDATLRGIWQALFLPVPASHPASAAPLPQGA